MATESDNVNSGALGTLVAVGTIAFFGIALVVTALVRAELSEEVAKKDISADRPYRDLVAEQTAKLGAPAQYVDRNRGLVSLPIDRAMELGYRHPMGPLRLTDLVGLDVRLAIAEHLRGALGTDRFAPPEILRRLVKEGKLGKKTGEGFYRWEGENAVPKEDA